MPLSLAVLGAGRIGKVHADAIAATPGARLVAVADAFETAANALAEAHGARVSTIDEILTALQAAGAQPALMAGSGATCYGLFTEEAEAQSAQQQLSLPDCWTHLTRFLPAKPG